MSEQHERLRSCPSLTECKKAADEIASLRAQIADVEGRLAANRALVELRDRRLEAAEAQLASARKAAIEECAALVDERSDCSSRYIAECIRELALTDE